MNDLERWWGTLEALDTVFGIAFAVIAFVGWAIAVRNWLRYRKLTKTQARLEQRASTLLVDLDEAAKENARLAEQRDSWIPAKWLAAADGEAAAGNEAKAIDLLDQGYQKVREDLGRVAHRIAEFHASRMIGSDAAFEHESARRLTQVARGLAPSRREIAELAEEMEAIEIVDEEPLRIAASRFDAATPDEAVRVIGAALTANRRLFEQGRYRVCILLCRRAVKLAKRHGLETSEIGLLARWALAQSLEFGGQYQEAFDTVRDLLPVRERVQGDEHPDVLTTRTLEAAILRDLGQYDDALTAVRDLLPVRERVQGDEHPDVLTTRYLEAAILRDLGQFDDALTAVRNLLPVESRVKGDEHPDVLITRRLHAEICLAAGDARGAQDELSPVLALQRDRLGPAYSDTLESELVGLEILVALGRPDEALAEIDRVHDALLAATGPGHVRVRQAEQLRQQLRGDERGSAA